jgi:hypothetical protein
MSLDPAALPALLAAVAASGEKELNVMDSLVKHALERVAGSPGVLNKTVSKRQIKAVLEAIAVKSGGRFAGGLAAAAAAPPWVVKPAFAHFAGLTAEQARAAYAAGTKIVVTLTARTEVAPAGGGGGGGGAAEVPPPAAPPLQPRPTVAGGLAAMSLPQFLAAGGAAAPDGMA